ncbi:MAG TPA: phosphoglycerate kinase, partial [Candidatus Paceibacterota bacterium]|nr:phosphoglycerate kinase [Candidatus Paceibacterota bacterium]
MRYIKSKDIFDKRVLMRVDFNVPIDKGKILDDFRIQRVLPTIQFLREKKAKKIILISHLGQPTSSDQKQLSLEPVAGCLEELLEEKVCFITTLVGEGLKEEIEELPDNSIILLENIRFYKGEMENSKKLAKELAEIADCFVNEAFSASHREAASLCAITEFLPSYSGILLEQELINLDRITQKSEHPLVVVLGGAKIKDKISVIEKFKDKADYILLGGLMANTILKANGFCIGRSLYDEGAFAQAEKISIGK